MNNSTVDNFSLPQDTDPADETPLDQNWQAIDGRAPAMLSAATIAGLTAAQKPDGRLVFDTTNRRYQWWDNINSVWVPVGASYHNLLVVEAGMSNGPTAGPNGLGFNGSSAFTNPISQGVIAPIYIAAADFPAGAKLNVRATITVGATALTGALTVSLYPLTVAAGSYNVGAAVAGVTFAAGSLGPANSVHSAASADFAPPADGLYCLAYTDTIAQAVTLNIAAALRSTT